MKKVGFLIFCLFAMCSMAGKAQDVVADSTGYIVKVGTVVKFRHYESIGRLSR